MGKKPAAKETTPAINPVAAVADRRNEEAGVKGKHAM